MPRDAAAWSPGTRWAGARRVLLLLVLAAALVGPVRAEGSHPETWLTVSADARLSPTMYLRVSEEARADRSTVYYTHTDLDLNWASHQLQFDTAGLGCRHAKVRGATGWSDQERLFVHGTANLKLGDLRLDDRNMVEYQVQRSSFGQWRYRNRLTLSAPVGAKAFVYLSDEISVRLDQLHLYRNRLNLGIRGPVTPALDADFFIQRQTTATASEDEGELYETAVAVGARLRFRF